MALLGPYLETKWSVIRSEAIPQIELDALLRELHRPLARQARQDGLQRLLLGDAGLEGLLAAEAGGDLQRLATVLAERREDVHEEVAVGDRLADLQRGVPGGEHRQVVLVEVGDRLGVVSVQLALWDLVDPRADELAEQLTPGLAADGLCDDADRVVRFDEAEGHGKLRALEVLDGVTVRLRSDGKTPDVRGRLGTSCMLRGFPRARARGNLSGRPGASPSASAPWCRDRRRTRR